jgi:hypothetical protein
VISCSSALPQWLGAAAGCCSLAIRRAVRGVDHRVRVSRPHVRKQLGVSPEPPNCAGRPLPARNPFDSTPNPVPVRESCGPRGQTTAPSRPAGQSRRRIVAARREVRRIGSGGLRRCLEARIEIAGAGPVGDVPDIPGSERHGSPHRKYSGKHSTGFRSAGGSGGSRALIARSVCSSLQISLASTGL